MQSKCSRSENSANACGIEVGHADLSLLPCQGVRDWHATAGPITCCTADRIAAPHGNAPRAGAPLQPPTLCPVMALLLLRGPWGAAAMLPALGSMMGRAAMLASSRGRPHSTAAAAAASDPPLGPIPLAFPALCVWGSNTGVGKTLFSAGLAAAARRAGVRRRRRLLRGLASACCGARLPCAAACLIPFLSPHAAPPATAAGAVCQARPDGVPCRLRCPPGGGGRGPAAGGGAACRAA